MAYRLAAALILVASQRYLMLVPKLGTVPRAIVLGLGTVAYFLVTMLVVMAGFIGGFTIIYSSTTTAFATPAASLLTLWSALLGNVDVDNFIQARSGPARLALLCRSPLPCPWSVPAA